MMRHTACVIKNETGIIVRSALKRRYRDRLREGNPTMRFIYLHGSYELIEARMMARAGHFMPAGLLKSQFEALEEPNTEESDVYRVNIDGDLTNVVNRCVAALQGE